MKILEIGSYPPPNTGWSVRIKFLRDNFIAQGIDCKILNIGRNRKEKSKDYIDVQNGIDFLLKLFRYRIKGYHFHIHVNAQAVKGPILALAAHMVSLMSGARAALTFHGGVEQLYFPKRNAGKMYWVIYLNFLLSRIIICNNCMIQKEISFYGSGLGKGKIFPIPAFSLQYLHYQTVKLPERVDSFIKKKNIIILCYIVLRNGFFWEPTIEYIKMCSSDIGFILCGIGEAEDEEVAALLNEIRELELKRKIITVDDLNHDEFMTLLKKSTLYLRTPVSDGVASSVLEALVQGIPVVASDNGRRPTSVITYDPNDKDDLDNKIDYVTGNYEKVKSALVKPKIEDTIKKEIELLKEKM